MKLQAEGLLAVTKGLVFVELARGEPLSTRGYAEPVIMRLQNHKPVGNKRLALGRRDQRVVSIFMNSLRMRTDLCPQFMREKLCAQAEAEKGNVAFQSIAHQSHLVLQKRMSVLVRNAVFAAI